MREDRFDGDDGALRSSGGALVGASRFGRGLDSSEETDELAFDPDVADETALGGGDVIESDEEDELAEEESDPGQGASDPYAAGAALGDEPAGNSREDASETTSECESASECESPSGAPATELSLEELKKALEAVLFAMGEPLAIRSLAELFGASLHDVRQAIESLKDEYVESGRSFRLEDVAGGVQLLTLPAYDVWIRKLRQTQSRLKLSAAAFETLAVIAYKQPITKADLEAIRGVQCGPVLKNLLDRGLVRVAGRDESLGRPLLYGTTTRFLESFGIANLRDLPQPDFERRGEKPVDSSEDEGDA